MVFFPHQIALCFLFSFFFKSSRNGSKKKQLFSCLCSYYFFFSFPAATALWKSGISGAATAVAAAMRL